MGDFVVGICLKRGFLRAHRGCGFSVGFSFYFIRAGIPGKCRVNIPSVCNCHVIYSAFLLGEGWENGCNRIMVCLMLLEVMFCYFSYFSF